MEIQELEIASHVIVIQRDLNRINVIGKQENAIVWMVSIIFGTVRNPLLQTNYKKSIR
jgi:hypothetical protein